MTYSQAEIDQAFEIIAFVSEQSRAERREAYKATARYYRDEWLMHARGCDRRAAEYEAKAAQFPAAHRDHRYYMDRAKEQRKKADEARQAAKVQEQLL